MAPVHFGPTLGVINYSTTQQARGSRQRSDGIDGLATEKSDQLLRNGARHPQPLLKGATVLGGMQREATLPDERWFRKTRIVSTKALVLTSGFRQYGLSSRRSRSQELPDRQTTFELTRYLGHN